MHTESLNRWYLDLQSQKVPALPVLTFLWKEMEVYKMPARMSTWSIKSIYQADPDSGGINSSHFWLSSSYRVRGGLTHKEEGETGSLGHNAVNTGESEFTGVSTAAGAKGTTWPREWKAEYDRFLLHGDRFKEFHAEGTLICHESGKNMYLGCSGKGREGWKTLLFQPVLSLVWNALPSDVHDCPSCSLRCVLALPKTACLNPASSLSSSFAHVMGWMAAPEKYGYILISGSYECDWFWKKNFCRCC